MPLEIQESISSFVDNELDVSDHEQLINKLHDNEKDKQVWGRYCVMSDAIKKTLPETLNHNLFKRVQLALEDEPALLAPVSNTVETQLPAAEIIKLPVKTEKAPTFKPAYGFGVAASLLVAVVVAFQMGANTGTVTNQLVAATPVSVPATQQINIASNPVMPVTQGITVSLTPNALKQEVRDAIYAEQSLMDGEEWTRITQIDGIPLASHFLSPRSEAHVQYKLQGHGQSLARSVNLEKSSAE